MSATLNGADRPQRTQACPQVNAPYRRRRDVDNSHPAGRQATASRFAGGIVTIGLGLSMERNGGAQVGGGPYLIHLICPKLGMRPRPNVHQVLYPLGQ